MNNENTDKTKVIRVFESFAGIGAQHKAITNIDNSEKYFKVVGTSEWDARAIIAYAQIHHLQEFKAELAKIKKWDITEIDNYCRKYVFSLNSKKEAHVVRKSLIFKQNLIAANIVNNNFSDIRSLSGKEVNELNINLLVYSFPCQGLSIANMGRDQGLGRNSNSTSNLIWQIHRILTEMANNNLPLPKYLLMENVNNLLGPKHLKDYQEWLSFLNSLGYTTKTLKLNGINFGSLQKRTRVFGISILNWDNKQSDASFKTWFLEKYSISLNNSQRKKAYVEILRSSANYDDEIDDATPSDTKSRRRMAKTNYDLWKRQYSKNEEWTFNTLTTKQDRHPNVGMITLDKKHLKPKKLYKRFVTNREAYLMMGFDNNDFNKVKQKYKDNILTKESLYRQAGNSIIVQVLEKVFQFFKDHHGGKND